MSVEKYVSQIEFEIKQIDHLLESYSKLLYICKTKKPDLVQITALASILHSFYNGLENMFLAIAKGIDLSVPQGMTWHKDLLIKMAKNIKNRKAVISEENEKLLAEYLAFRHFYRHSYSFFIEWDELEKLVYPLEDIWNRVKKEINNFLADILK